MKIVSELSEPPVQGEHYLVPTVTGEWCGKVSNWPVIGAKHEDKKFFDFETPHYHIDLRFLSDRSLSRLQPRASWRGTSLVGAAQATPLHDPITLPSRAKQAPLPAPVLRRRKCQRAAAPWEHPELAPCQQMQKALAGTQCRRDQTGWVCPHRNVSLGSVPLDKDGVLMCPLHGLRIDPVSGVVLSGEAA